MERPGQRIGADGPSAPRGPAEPGAPEDDDAEKVLRRLSEAFGRVQDSRMVSSGYSPFLYSHSSGIKGDDDEFFS